MRKFILAVGITAVVSAPGCAGRLSECGKVLAAVELACPIAPESEECKRAQRLAEQYCGIPVPVPTPTPEPTPTPTPEPTPTPTPTPEPTPTPTPEPPKPQRYEMGVYWLYDQTVADATPKQCGFDVCEAAGFPGRLCCPAAPEGDDTRFAKECEMMGGCAPVWSYTPKTGNVQCGYEDDREPWKARCTGQGTGTLQGCFPNGKACGSVEVNRP